jgi:dTDP-4-amino-4,6-dideoxygalactose transaminase
MKNAVDLGLAPLSSEPEPSAVPVMRPTLPDLHAYTELLESIWASHWLTNLGKCHVELEEKIAEYLNVKHLSLVSSGTLALLLALRMTGVRGGTVVTTPFTFPATTHCIEWSNATPIFADVELGTGNIDANSVRERIRADTKAILAVHVYGTPCDHQALQSIADEHGLALIYDAAHAFGVEVDGHSILNWGDASTLSFHATKLFSTVEGGAVVVPSARDKAHMDRLRNFGIVDEETVVESGLNAKLNELQAAYGLLRLPAVPQEIAARRAIAAVYDDILGGLNGLEIITRSTDANRNFSYYAVRILCDESPIGRDCVYEAMKRQNIFLRKYFHPLLSSCPSYAGLLSAAEAALPNASRLDKEVLCLPMYGCLTPETAARVAKRLRQMIEPGGDPQWRLAR